MLVQSVWPASLSILKYLLRNTIYHHAFAKKIQSNQPNSGASMLGSVALRIRHSVSPSVIDLDQ